MLKGAKSAEKTAIFDPWTEGGHVFYKVAEDAISPRHFKDTGAIGTVAVRYVVQAVDPHTTHLLIDAAYFEMARRELHPSDGSVEVAEFGEIREHLDKLLERRKLRPVSASESSSKSNESTPLESTMPSATPPTSAQPVTSASTVNTTGPLVVDLESKVAALRRQVEAQVTSSSAILKTAPYKRAADVVTLPAQTHVVVLIVTKYWLGVETADGHHGWLPRTQLEFVQ